MIDAPLWAAWSGIALVIFMAGVLAGYMIARAVMERAKYDAEIAGYESTLAERRRPRHARPPLEELEAPKSTAPAFGIGQIQAAWPRPSHVLIIAAGSQRSRFPLEDTGTLPALSDTGELRALELTAAAARNAMIADNTAWLEAWAGAAP